MNTGSVRALIYVRQSRDGTGDGAAVERQEEACRGLATARGWEVVDVLADNDVSASSGRVRPAWEATLQRLERGEVGVLLAYHLDRITRTMTELERLILVAERVGVGIATATGDIDLTTDSGRMVARILAAVARAEVERKADRQVLANRQRVSRGRPRWSHRPFGFVKEDLSHHPTEAPLLKDAYARVLTGTRPATIVREWNEAGVLTSTGVRWTTQSFGKLMRNERNAGIIRYRGQPAGKGEWEPIVDEDTFRVAVARLDASPFNNGGGAGSSDAPLVTVAHCGSCGGRIYSATRKGLPPHYTCQSGCIWMPRAWADSRVLYAVAEMMDDPTLRERWSRSSADAGEEAGALREERALLNERLATMGVDFAEGVLPRAALIAGTERVQARLAEIDERLASLSAEDEPVVMDIETLAAQLEEMSAEEERAWLRSITSSITLHRRGKGSRAPLTPDLVQVVPRAVG